MFPKYTTNINQQKVQRALVAYIDRFEKKLIQKFQFAAEKFVAAARSKTPDEGSFEDQTGNLRSSIGYVILRHGNPVMENFQVTKNGDLGLKNAKKFLKKLAANHPRGIVLIVCAGMDYALIVESKGKDVITGSSIQLMNDVRKMIENINR